MEKERFLQLQEETNEFLPYNIIDSHTHTGTNAFDIDISNKEPYPLSYGLMNNRKLRIPLGVFNEAFPARKIKTIGFPLPLPFNSNPYFWNTNLMIEEMQKGSYGLMHFMKELEAMQEAIDIAATKNLSFSGIKFHPRMFSEKEKKMVLLNDLINSSVLDFAEKNKLTMLMELSHGYCAEDIELLREIDETRKINVVIPHLGFNYKGFMMTQEEYEKSLIENGEKYEQEMKPLKETNRIFLDTALVTDKRMIQAGLNIFGEDKIMYGSDYPFCFTQRISDYREADSILINAIQKIIDSEPFENKWKYDYNLLMQAKAIQEAEKSLKLDIREKIMRENAKKAFRLNQ